jgi:leucyl aminopeptidase (aminopeptidase T)
MNYREIFREENTLVIERYLLAVERIKEFLTEETVKEPFRTYFRKASKFVEVIDDLVAKLENSELDTMSIEQLELLNKTLYQDILIDNYESSYANPTYAVSTLGEEHGQALCYVYFALREMISYAYEFRHFNITIYMELLIQIYNEFENEETPTQDTIKEIIYSFSSDYCDHITAYQIRDKFDPNYSFAVDIINNSNLNDLRYLYKYGEYISDNEIKMAEYMNSLTNEKIDDMAATYVEAYERGFTKDNIDLSIKEYVEIRFNIGFERMIKAAFAKFKKIGLTPTIYRANPSNFTRVGFTATLANKQAYYDHRYDNALFLDKAYIELKLAQMRVAYEEVSEFTSKYSGITLVEIFGEKLFQPKAKPEALKLSAKQEKIWVDFQNRGTQLFREFIKKDETSFTIIAYPISEIGENFEEIFDETIKVNTLDANLYERIQQTIIDTLDTADHAHILGANGNRTDLIIKLHELVDPSTQTVFENCVADVNVPVGEVFTSPVLKGTNGILHVTDIFLRDLRYVDLELTFEDGYITKYSCKNFEDEEENQKFLKETLLNSRDTLPMGEFAIGTNTTAYTMGKKYDIISVMPILIVEKMGPHFAIGDTCYSWGEDLKIYNPDGKEIVAKDNDLSILRKEDVSKAYTGCHTDITIPYNELGSISAVKKNGEEIFIIKEGIFALAGTEELNEALI